MVAFEVNDMACGQAVGTLTKALKAADQDARVQIDPAPHRVRVDPGSADALELAQAIQDAGDTPVQVEAVTGASTAQQRGGCCGRCH